MLTLQEVHEAARKLEDLMALRNAPIAVKLINKDEIPEGCPQPSAEGKHYALCQALSYVRRARKPLAMFAEDHWCLWPVINFRLRTIDAKDEEYVGSSYFIRDPEVSLRHFRAEYPYIDEDKQKDGMVLAPLGTCNFLPDAVMIYCSPSQLRQFLMAAKFDSGNITQACLDTCDSCGAALVPVLNGTMEYNLSMPDAGEFERGLCGEDEMIFTLRGENLGLMTVAAEQLAAKGFGYKQLTYDLKTDYMRPEFYNNMFKKWGLATSDDLWIPGKR